MSFSSKDELPCLRQIDTTCVFICVIKGAEKSTFFMFWGYLNSHSLWSYVVTGMVL